MQPVCAALHGRIGPALDKLAGQDRISYDLYWQHDPLLHPRQPILYLVLIIPSGLVNGPPLTGVVQLPDLQLAGGELQRFLAGAAGALRKARRDLLAAGNGKITP